jgi:hypothetical protein
MAILTLRGRQIGSATQAAGAAYFEPDPLSEGRVIPRSRVLPLLLDWAMRAPASSGRAIMAENSERPAGRD